MVIKNSHELMIGLIALALMHIGALTVIISIQSAFAHNTCIGQFTCSAIGGSGGRGGDTGDAISGDIGPGGSCFARNHSTIGDECGGSTGSSEPRSGSGDHSMNGGRGGEATVNLSS
jgi:hypothetical protein